MADPTVYLRPPGFPWQVVGRELYSGLYPANVHVEADSWGFASCSFDLPRDPFVPSPDLASFVPCRIEEGRAKLFDGKVQETPARGDPEPLISVSGRGRQYALDENPVEHSWLHSDLSAWKDVRSIGGYDPAVWRPNTLAEAGDGAIVLGRNVGEPWYGSEGQGVYLDLGSEQRVSRIELTFTQQNIFGNGVFSFYARGRADDNNISSGSAWTDAAFGGAGFSTALTSGRPTNKFSDAIYLAGGTVIGGSYVGYFSPPARLVAVFLWWIGAGGGTPVTVDHLLTINRIALYGDGMVGAEGRGNLRASDVVADVVERSSVGISVPEQSFAPDHYYQDELRTGLEDIGGRYYPFRPLAAPLTEAWTGVVSGLLRAGITPTYHDSGGPCLDDDPLGSAYAQMSSSAGYYAATSAVWPATQRGWVIMVWFRTHAGASYVGTSYATLNNRVVATDDVSAPTVLLSDFGAGVRTDGKLHIFWRNSALLAEWVPNTFVADGDWHMLYLARNRHNGTFNFALDGEGDEQAYPQDWFGPTRGQTTRSDTLLAFGNRSGSDKQFNGDVAEIAWFNGEIPVSWAKHLYNAARRNDTPLKRTELVLPGYATSSARTPRDAIEPVNSLHRFVTKVGWDGMMEFRPQPVRPKYALTAAASRKFEQTSLTAADESYNRALVIGQDLFGNPMRVERVAGQQPEALLEIPDHVAVANGQLDTGSSSPWSGAGLTFLLGPRPDIPSGGEMTVRTTEIAGAFYNLNGWFEGRFLRGRLYRLSFTVDARGVYLGPIVAAFGSIFTGDFGRYTGTPVNWMESDLDDDFKFLTIDWIPERDYDVGLYGGGDLPKLYIETPGAGVPGYVSQGFYISNVVVRVGVNSSLDRLNDLRTRVIENSAILSPVIGEAMADGFLRNRARQQLKGSVQVAPGDVVDYRSGAVVHPSYLAEDTMELLHVPSLVDPDTGAQGRDGQMVGVSYDCDSELASVTIDNSRDNFEAMMQRYAMFAGGGVGG